VKDLRYVEGSFDRRLVLDWMAEEDITFGTGGWAPMLTGSGLGVGIEPERVDAMTVRQEVLLGPA
jgi:muconate cycloisomerase